MPPRAIVQRSADLLDEFPVDLGLNAMTLACSGHSHALRTLCCLLFDNTAGPF